MAREAVVGEQTRPTDLEKFRWGRAEPSEHGERHPPIRSDWSDEPNNWLLRPPRSVEGLPASLANELERLDCALPKARYNDIESAVISGEFERSGQRDIAVLCVHQDQTSAVYVFWEGDPAKRAVMPASGNSISMERRGGVEKRLDIDKPVAPDMPTTVEHDAIEIGCCECCSAFYYLHDGLWFTLPGAD